MGEGVSQAKNQDIDAHLVLTVYDSKDWIGDFLEPAVEIEKSGKPGVFYTDPEKAGKYSVLRINKETILSGFTGHTIQDIGINVKSQSETLQFKFWFGDSKVVDENGKPLEVYHGTNWDGWEFDTENGAFFSEKEDYAEEMAAQRGGSRTVKAYLSIKNPLVVKVPGNKMADPEFEARIIAEAKSKGHDGVKLETDTNNEIEKDVFWVAFEPNQIKSATDNVGTFDPGNNDVRFSVAPDDAFVQAWAKVLLPVVSTQYINVDVLHFQSLFSKKRIFCELLLFAAVLLIPRAFLCQKEKKRKPEQKYDLLRRTAVLRVMACSGSMIQCLNRIRCPDRQPIWDPV